MRLAVALALGAAALAGPARAGDDPAADPAGPPATAVFAAPATTPGTLRLSGDGQTGNVACGGRNVLIEGSNGRFTLRGGCRSVTVQGNADTVLAELGPRARIAVAGDGVRVRYTLIAAGAAPVVSVAGTGNVVQPASP